MGSHVCQSVSCRHFPLMAGSMTSWGRDLLPLSHTEPTGVPFPGSELLTSAPYVHIRGGPDILLLGDEEASPGTV